MKFKSIVLFFFLTLGGFLLNANGQSYGYSYIERYHEDPAGPTRIYAEGGTVLDYSTWYYYDPGIQAFLYEDATLIASTDRIMNYNGPTVAVYTDPTPEARYGSTYTLHSDHFLGAYFYYISGGQPVFIDQYGFNFFQGNFPTPYSFSQGPTGYYSYRIYKVATTQVSIQATPPLHLTSIDTAGGVPGQSFATELRGTGLFGTGNGQGANQTVQVSGSGVTATVHSTTPNTIEVLDVNIEIADDAQPGDRNLTLTVNGQTSNSINFRVGDRSPQITDMTPSQANAGDQVAVTITGSNFGFNPDVEIAGLGIARSITSSTTTQIQAVFSVDPNADTGARGVVVRSKGISGTGFQQAPGNSDTSNGRPFEVTALTVQIDDVPVLEKNGERTVNVNVSGLTGTDQIKFTLKPLEGATGEAQFDNNSSEITKGNGENQALKIKGITESSAANKMTIQATLVNNDSTVLAHKEFTVGVITALEFDVANSPIDANPGPNGGLRIFPDKNEPTDATNRSVLLVKATVSPAIPNLKVYFASFDLDDPSSDVAPIDPLGSDGNDNNGAVNGSKSGEFSNPAGGSCSNPSTGSDPNYVSKIECATSSANASVNFKTTLQPGDNFAIAASLVDTYRDSIKVDSTAGANLINPTSQILAISGDTNPSNVEGIRTPMLTVWRKVHLEVDSMGNVGSGNNVTGTVTAVNQYTDPTCVPPLPSPPPCYNTLVGYDITTSDGSPLELARFQNGRIQIGLKSFNVFNNLTNRIYLKGVPSGSIKNIVGQSFTLYDDDDYDASPALLNGDNNKPIVRLPCSFQYLSADDVNCHDGTPRNLYASAYIMPEYNWAVSRGYNQTNLQFELNVEDGTHNANLINVLNRNRDSKNDEKDDFWVAYILIGYQGPLTEDFDGVDPTGQVNENARLGVGATQFIIGSEIDECDCYNSPVCPTGGRSCTLPNGTPAAPRGALGSLIFQEVQQDLTKYFLSPPSPVTPRSLDEIRITIPHELGHQFGVLGDQNRSTFKIMDYSDYVRNVINDLAFQPEHINIMRRRVKSPGN